MLHRTPRLLLAGAFALLLAACGTDTPTTVATPKQTRITTATPYPQPPVPTIVDASGGSSAGGAAPRETTYRIEAGDTLLTIAKRYDATVEAIVKRNNITNPTDLKIGQELVIPTTSTVLGTATPAPTATGTVRPGATGTATPSTTGTPRPSPTPTSTPAPTTTPAGRLLTYTVRSGDTSFDIASRFEVTVEDLAAANNRTVASLASIQIGDTLSIPRPR